MHIVQKKIAAQLIEFAEKWYFTDFFKKYDLIDYYKNTWFSDQITPKFVARVNTILRKKLNLKPGIDVYKL